jgi:hypothetical protein
MRLPAFWALAGTVSLALAAAAVALPHAAYQRFQAFGGTIFARLGWVYERIHFDPAPIDVVVLGASREGQAISAALLEEALAARGLPWRVANFSLPASGMDVRLTLLNELLRTKRPKLVVISVVERLPRDGHQAFGTLAPATEILAAPWLVNRNLPENLARLPIRQLKLALISRDPAGFGQSPTFDPRRYQGTTRELRPVDVHGTSAPPRNLTQEELARNSAMRLRQMRPPLLPEALGDVEFGVSRHYLREIAAVARSHGAEVRFIFLPFYRGHRRPLDASWVETIAPIISTDRWMDDWQSYRDEGHMRTEMRPDVAAWLADELVRTAGEKE